MAKNAGEKAGSGLVKQKHGGRIYQGAPANVVPGPGRPPSEIRRRLRGTFSERMKILEEIANEAEKPSDRLKALDLMAKYGLGAARGYDEALVEALGNDLVAVLQDELSEEVAHRVWERARQSWVTTIGLHVRGE